MIKLDLKDFKKRLRLGFLRPKLTAFDSINKKRFAEMEKRVADNTKALSLSDTFRELKKRTGRNYFNEVLLAQLEALDYASLFFPAYKFIAPEDLSDDWLATVDFHKRFSRDHSLHQPLTAYCAASLLGFGDPKESLNIPKKQGNLLDFCVDSIIEEPECEYLRYYAGMIGIGKSLNNGTLKREFWTKLFYRSVVLSALFHDMGYPWQYVNRLRKPLEGKLANVQGMADNVDDCISVYGGKLFMVPFSHYDYAPFNPPLNTEPYDKDLISEALRTHGMPGAQAFLTLNDLFREYPSLSGAARSHEFSVEWAALGIMMHDLVDLNTPGRPFRIDFKKDPLSGIVTMADYLEEFGRPLAEFDSRINKVNIDYRTPCKESSLYVKDGALTITMRYEKNADLANAKSFKQKETNEYFETGTGYLDMTSIGIKTVEFVPIV